MDNIAILAAHPDDVACCMGGTLLKLKGQVAPHVLCATKGERGCPGEAMDEVAAGVGEATCPILYFEAALSSQVSQFRPDV